MKKRIKALICGICLICCLGMLAGCGENNVSPAATPGPTNTAAGASPSEQAASQYLRPRDENLKNAIKEGETYRYFVWTTNDPANPFELEAEGSRDFLIKRRSEYESKYGITIEYVQTASDWAFSFAAAAYSGAPMADIFNAGGPFNVISHYNYEGNPGSILEPLSQYSEYADFNDSEWFDTQSQKITTFNGQLYFAVPNIVGIDSVGFNQAVFFNKALLADKGYEDSDIYEMYREGTWNWEKFKEIAVRCTDLDNGVYGIHSGEGNSLMWGLMPSNDSYILSSVADSETGESYYQFSGDSANALETWDFFLELGRQNVLTTELLEDVAFRGGNVAMMSTYINRAAKITNYRQYPQFGIVPVPKGPKADEYVSSCNWFVPLCVFKGTANPAGSVQVLSEYCAPRYARSSQEAQADFETGAMKIVCDTQSVEVLRSIPEISITEPYILYWNTPTFVADGTESGLYSLYNLHNEAFIQGSTTPAVLFSSVKEALNQALKDVQIND